MSASPEEGTTSTKEVPIGDGGGKVWLGRCTVNEFDGLRFVDLPEGGKGTQGPCLAGVTGTVRAVVRP